MPLPVISLESLGEAELNIPPIKTDLYTTDSFLHTAVTETWLHVIHYCPGEAN